MPMKPPKANERGSVCLLSIYKEWIPVEKEWIPVEVKPCATVHFDPEQILRTKRTIRLCRRELMVCTARTLDWRPDIHAARTRRYRWVQA